MQVAIISMALAVGFGARKRKSQTIALTTGLRMAEKKSKKSLLNLDSPEGRKEVLKDIVKRFYEGEATSSDAKGAVDLLMKIENDYKNTSQDELKADPYSVMKVFLRAEGLTAVESIRKSMKDNDLAEGIAKVLGAVRLSLQFPDGGVGRYIKIYEQERKDAKPRKVEVNEAQRVECGSDAGDESPKSGDADNESGQEEGQPA